MSTILVAEPKGAVCKLLHIVLDLNGHEPVDHDEPGALDRVDLAALIVDPVWPDGLLCAHRLRDARPDLPIVCVSNHSPTPEAESLRPSGYLVMPFRLQELESAMERALGT